MFDGTVFSFSFFLAAVELKVSRPNSMGLPGQGPSGVSCLPIYFSLAQRYKFDFNKPTRETLR